MSAWDITGAVVWTLAAILSAEIGCYSWKRKPENSLDTPKCLAVLFTATGLGFLAASIFCIVRLFGAHL